MAIGCTIIESLIPIEKRLDSDIYARKCPEFYISSFVKINRDKIRGFNVTI
jgi:hypothetical protein